MPTALPVSSEMFGPGLTPAEYSERKDALVKAATESTISAMTGETYWAQEVHSAAGVPTIAKRADKRREIAKALEEIDFAKSASPQVLAALNDQLTGAKTELLSKEWTLSNPINTG